MSAGDAAIEALIEALLAEPGEFIRCDCLGAIIDPSTGLPHPAHNRRSGCPFDPGAEEQRTGPAWDGERSRYDAREAIPERPVRPRRQLDPVIDLGWRHIAIGAVALFGFAFVGSGVFVQWHDYQARQEAARVAALDAEIARAKAVPPDDWVVWNDLDHEFVHRSVRPGYLPLDAANSHFYSGVTTRAAEFQVAEEKLVSFQDGSREILSIDMEGNVELGQGVTTNQASLEFWKLVKANQPR